MSVTVNFDSAKFRQSLTQFSQLTGKSVEDVVREELGSMARTIIRYTPPTNVKQGKDAVERDIRKLFTSPKDLFPNGAKITRLKQLIDQQQWNSAADFIANIPAFQKLKVADSVDTSLHQQYRKNGRVRTKSGPFVLIRDPAVLKAYIQAMQQHVGKAKSAWLAAVSKYGGSAVAAWISKHGTTEGAVIDALRDGSGFVEALTGNPGAVQLDARLNIVERAAANTDKALNIKLSKTLEKLAKAV